MMETIVVGVDGSEAAGVALEFAVEEAAFRGANLRVVSVWDIPTLVQPEVVTVPDVFDGLRDEAGAVVAEAVARARELRPTLSCEGAVLSGRAADVLIGEGRGAALVVVGRRGHGGITGILLGSVSRHVADHAPCPVVVVPPLARG
jgi:nucleotide-binding universal stress UspA family protein